MVPFTITRTQSCQKRKPDGNQPGTATPIDHIAVAHRDKSADCHAKWAGTPGVHSHVGTDVPASSVPTRKRMICKLKPRIFFDIHPFPELFGRPPPPWPPSPRRPISSSSSQPLSRSTPIISPVNIRPAPFLHPHSARMAVFLYIKNTYVLSRAFPAAFFAR